MEPVIQPVVQKMCNGVCRCDPAPEVESEPANSTNLFNPVDSSWQRNVCYELGLPLFKKTKYKTVCLGLSDCKPTKLYTVKGDGNCFFRCLSYMVTGDEDHHTVMRQWVVNTTEEKHIYGDKPSVGQYLTTSKMELDRTWSTEVEIFAAADALDCDIYIYSKTNGSGQWLRHPAGGINAPVCRYRKAIYLNNEYNSHYDVVLSIDHPDAKYRKKNLLWGILKVILFLFD